MRRAMYIMVSVLAGAAVAAAGLAACGGAGGGPSGGPSPSETPSSPPSVASSSAASPRPSQTTGGSGMPVVYLLGGSSARECVVGDASWAAAVKEAGGPSCRTIDMGSTNETFINDQRLVKAMPKTVPTLVVIGVNVGRFTSAVSSTMLNKPLTAADQAALAGKTELEHRYTLREVKPPAEKERLVAQWLSDRYPLFRKNYKANLEQLKKLIEACQAKGFRVALLELPIDLQLIGDRFDTPRKQYSGDAERLARAHGIPYLSFLDSVGLVNGDFYDLLHLVEPGRAKWQARLAKDVAKLLDEYGMGAGK